MKKYLISLSLLVIALACAFALLGRNFPEWQQMIFVYILVYFVIVTVISHIGLERSTKSRPQVFVRYYMASTSIRLLAHLIFIVMYSILNQPHAKYFIILFMIMYFLFTIYEVVYVMRNKP